MSREPTELDNKIAAIRKAARIRDRLKARANAAEEALAAAEKALDAATKAIGAEVSDG